MRTILSFCLLLLLVAGCVGSDRRPTRETTAPDSDITLMEDPAPEDPASPDTPPDDMPTPGIDEVDPDDPCMGIDYLGSCDGATAVWCQDGALRTFDCAGDGQVCGWIDDSVGYYCMADTGSVPDTPTESCGTAIEQEQLRFTNEARVSAGLGALVCDEALTLAARLHSQDMCELMYFEHDSADGRTFADRIREQGVSYRRAGENIAHGQDTAEEVHIAWMNSPGHRANILQGAFGRVGIGYVACGGRPYWTQDFAD